jgi:exosome complex exonuclease RRP6
MDPSKDFNSLQEAIQKSLVSTVKSANRIASQDLSFQRTINPDVAEQLDETTSRILDLSTRLINSAAQACGQKPLKLEDPEDVDMNWRAVVDVVDSILEKADRAMDEYTGLVKQRENGDSDSVRLLQPNTYGYNSNFHCQTRTPRQSKLSRRVKLFETPM